VCDRNAPRQPKFTTTKLQRIVQSVDFLTLPIAVWFVPDHTHIPVFGIVGGIGSGKSSVARWVVTHDSAVVLINGDEVGHEVLTHKAVQEAIRQRFGGGVFDGAGQIDRRSLGQIVFGPSDEKHAARRDLERIVHPRIRETFEKRIAEAEAAKKHAVLLDAAVLFEAGWNDLCHAIVFIDVPRGERLRRLHAGRGWDEAEVERREASQVSLETKRSRSNFVIDNAHSVDEAGRQLKEVLSKTLTRIHAQTPSDPFRN
jgi:dephospho-CoA kinase